MNINCLAEGCITVKIQIADVFNCPYGYTSTDVSEMVKTLIETMIGKCEVMNNDLKTTVLKINKNRTKRK